MNIHIVNIDVVVDDLIYMFDVDKFLFEFFIV